MESAVRKAEQEGGGFYFNLRRPSAFLKVFLRVYLVSGEAGTTDKRRWLIFAIKVRCTPVGREAS